MKLFAKKRQGSVIIEVAITFPVLCNLIFFMLEMIKINDVQMAVESIATEMAFEFMASKKSTNFQTIVDKYRPIFIEKSRITWYFDIYTSLSAMNGLSANGYVGEVFWPTSSSQNSTFSSPVDYSDIDRSGAFTAGSADNRVTLDDYKVLTKANTTVKFSGNAFVLTVVCDYPFQSDFIRRLFRGGKNTKGTKFLFWGRSVGVCS
ncbi:MAG: hypothetical protein LBJ71_00190 [Holosporaceae bacterium]|jgi:hypothetical protein|nr:hypothetical protein [Holosporaceae bacterium]